MFFFKKTFKAPWETSFSERLKKLLSPSVKKKAVYLYEKPDASTFRYRVYNMCQTLESSKEWTGTYFFTNELPLLAEYLEQISLIIFCRMQWSFAADHLIERANYKKIPLLFDIDDLVFNLDKLPLVMHTLNVPLKNHHINLWFAHSSRFMQLGKKCDGTIGTNAYLAKHLEEIFQKPGFVISNFLNQEQIKTSIPLFKENLVKKNKNFTLGYFSGSPSHTNDFGKITLELSSFLSEHPDAQLKVGGFMQFASDLRPFVKNKQIQRLPFVDYLTLQHKIASIDVNLIPLVDNEFTMCKSELKFFEAAIVGAVSLATPTYVYKHNIEHGNTGYLCQEGDWYTTLKKLYKEGKSEQMIQCANNYCLNKYAPEKQLPLIEEVLNKALCIAK